MTLLWQRHALSNIVLGYYNDFDFLKVAVGSEGEASRRVAESNGWDYIEYPNEDFTAKWNAGSEYFKDKDIDGLLIIGSDDLLCSNYITFIKENKTFDRIETNQMYFYNGTDLALVGGMIFGAGRYVSKRVLEGTNYRLWTDGSNRNCDYNMDIRCYPYERKRLLINKLEYIDSIAVDIKSGVNVWSFDYVTNAHGFEYTEKSDFQNRFKSIYNSLQNLLT